MKHKRNNRLKLKTERDKILYDLGWKPGTDKKKFLLDSDIRILTSKINRPKEYGWYDRVKAGERLTELKTKKRNLLKRAGLNPHVHTKIQLKKMTKAGLIRLVIKLEKFIVSHAYEMYKSKLPRLRTTKQKALPFRKTKRKKLTGAAKAKFLARMNKGRRRKGLKPIRSR